jgi:signal transduction histidine kinase
MELWRSTAVFGLAIVLVLAAASAVLAIIVQRSVDRVDAQALAEQRSIIDNVLKLKAEQFHAVVEEFGEHAPLTARFEAVQALLDAKGPEMKFEHDVDAILIYDADGRLRAQFVDQNASAALTRAIAVTGFARRQRASLPTPMPGQPEPVAGAYLSAFGKIYSAGFSAVRGRKAGKPERQAGPQIAPAPFLYMLWLSDITQAESDILASKFAFSQLSLTGLYKHDDRPGPASHPLTDDTGDVVGWFAWTPDTYGQEIMAEVRQWGPLVGLLAFAMLSFMAAFWAALLAAASRTQAQAAEAQRSNAAKSQFLANMSHELRTPLNAIIGFAEMMKTELFGPIGHARYRDYVGTIHESGTHLLGVIDQVLNLAKIESKTRDFARETVPLDALVAGVVEMARPSALEKGLSLGARVERGLCALGDQTALRQALINLVGNAIKYTDKGGLHVEAVRAGDDFATLEVRDTGIGISSNHLAGLGAPFHQVHDAFVQNRGGVGLGLSITRALLEGMGGRLDIASKVGQGTTVTIWIPLAAARDQAAA